MSLLTGMGQGSRRRITRSIFFLTTHLSTQLAIFFFSVPVLCCVGVSHSVSRQSVSSVLSVSQSDFYVWVVVGVFVLRVAVVRGVTGVS